MKRRYFLQGAGAALGVLGWSQLEVQRQGLRYAQVLAQDTPRKLALLIGINDYFQAKISPLRGCITDVELQRELLIHRFGFNPQDILMVTDNTPIKPTRAGLIEAVESHLIAQAKPGDVVVLHFSGHGAQVVNPYNPLGNPRERLNSTFVPSDRQTLIEEGQRTVSDIMGASLFLWMSAINTENITVVLDSCHSGGGKRGNLTIRAIPGGDYPNAEERDYHQQWISQLGVSQQQFVEDRQKGVAKGVVIASAAATQLAADAAFEGFFAGAFTYVLTQYLWQQTGSHTVKTVVGNVSRSTMRISSTRQVPEMEVKPGSGNESQPTYFLPVQSPPAEAVITAVNGDRLQVWLGGIDPQSLTAFNRNAVFAVVTEAEPPGLVQIESRQGLLAQGKAVASSAGVKPGALLQEQARAIPDNLTLRIGLDESLGGELEAANRAVAALERMEALPLGETEVHYILGRMTEALHQEVRESGMAEVPAVGSLGLYDAGLDLIPGSFGEVGESVVQGCDRLKSKFRALLAARLVKLTLNAESSRLNVSLGLKMLQGSQAQFAASAFTTRGGSGGTTEVVTTNLGGGIPRIPVGVEVQCEVRNGESRDLYVTLLVITTTGELVVVFPNSWTAGVDAALVKAGETRLIPESGDPFKLTISPPLGTAEILAIASLSPLRTSLQQLQQIAAARGTRDGVLGLAEESVSAVENLWGDLNQSRSIPASFDPRSRVAQTEEMAALSITFQVV
ncbi:caspase family protein [Phormidium pseudopriestleyi FRX01]|uniref:Caspase family protein n=1 Tax=Phormidium pseudopriestleyi FRX01 TaxID=1759528 RepID=A0ABS3FPR6_9CYAN|nr:caspase family protein [Phormidium pseudopriestleyi]MBO0349114.1 caspase family protein [Phormidium pseudopriestleyi FRX01]